MSCLLDELNQSRPFRSPQHEAVLAILRTADVVRRAIARAVEPHGLSTGQYNILRILRGANGEPLPTLDIAARMVEGSPAITRLLDKLEAKSLVVRHRCGDDRRRILCALTPAGLELLDSLDSAVDDANRAAVAALDPESLSRLVALLEQVRGTQP